MLILLFCSAYNALNNGILSRLPLAYHPDIPLGNGEPGQAFGSKESCTHGLPLESRGRRLVFIGSRALLYFHLWMDAKENTDRQELLVDDDLLWLLGVLLGDVLTSLRRAWQASLDEPGVRGDRPRSDRLHCLCLLLSRVRQTRDEKGRPSHLR